MKYNEHVRDIVRWLAADPYQRAYAPIVGHLAGFDKPILGSGGRHTKITDGLREAFQVLYVNKCVVESPGSYPNELTTDYQLADNLPEELEIVRVQAQLGLE